MTRILVLCALMSLIVDVNLAAEVCTVFHSSATNWHLDCSSRNMFRLPDYEDVPIVNLNLRNNSFDETIAFRGWKSLKYVDLSYNEKLTVVGNQTFDGIDELSGLNVSYCNLHNISGPLLFGKLFVQSIDLSGNPDLVDSDTFPILLTNLTNRGTSSLYLSYMGLTQFGDVFPSTKNLRRLVLRNNLLFELPVFPSTLNYLDIGNNSYTVLEKEPFALASELTVLLVENNANLTDIDEEAFCFMENLITISLAGNIKLEHIPNGAFYHNRHLKELSLAGCNFKTISASFKPVFFNLQSIVLENNPWRCNPSIQWLSLVNESLRCDNGMLLGQHFGKMRRTVVKNIMIVMVVTTFSLFIVGCLCAYYSARRRQEATHYWPLGKQNLVTSPVYVSTVL